MLVEVASVLRVPVAVVKVVHMITVLNGLMPAALAVNVGVIGLVVLLMIGGGHHLDVALSAHWSVFTLAMCDRQSSMA